VTITSIALTKIIADHCAWLSGETGGIRADLRGADLMGADLRGADLRSAVLRGADLRSADLSGCNGMFSYAQVSFIGHGECGRTLTAIRRKEGDAPELSCGCFDGNTKQLREYIERGPDKYKKTRTLALDTVLMLLDARNDEVAQ
jgi:uncharacterized protein YjbI with pentapeptide repeats